MECRTDFQIRPPTAESQTDPIRPRSKMDWQPEKPDGEPDPLDRLLADARWAEPAPEAIDRLRGQWRSLMLRRARRRRHLFALATAGSLLALGLGLWQFLSPTLRSVQENQFVPPSRPQTVKVVQPKRDSSLAVKHPRVAPPAAKPRHSPANPYEQMLATAHRRVVRQRHRELAAEPAETTAPREPPAAFAVKPTSLNVPQAASSATLGRLAIKEPDAAVRQQMLSVLFARHDRASLNVFLERVEDPRTSADALACVSDTADLPVQTLFQSLYSPKSERRIAAARVLGRLDRPEVSRELITMVTRGICRQEAMIALLSSSETTARQFLADAERNPLLSATLWNAKQIFQSSLSWRS
jgi:hypothetical protein